ncbi:MAG: phospholipase D-like domain-containing protein [Candidimonas sp.]|jgi:cardiolipin synthase
MAQTLSTLQQLFADYWPHIIFVLGLVASASAAIHAAMTKSDVRAAIGWVGISLMSPLAGPLMYLVAGINRVRQTQVSEERDKTIAPYAENGEHTQASIDAISGAQFHSLKTLGDGISHFPLLGGNNVTLLQGGDQAYPAMLQAIENAHTCIALQTYIFDNDAEGRKFVDALSRAHERGVEIRVLIDAVGAKYSRPPIVHQLRKRNIPCALFMTTPLGWRMPYANLRSHRKILVVDGHCAFTGGMNIRAGFVTSQANQDADRDTHFRILGPLVQQLMSVFAHDWAFTTKEALPYDIWFDSEYEATPPFVAGRCIQSGPDRYIASTHSMLLGAFAVAQHHIRIQSPYFLPDQILMGAIKTAARRGIRVDIVIPGTNNLRLVNYAMMAQLDQILHSGCTVWLAQGTFNHSKLITIDGGWTYIGSSNLDPRSLRLNFELDMEIYDRELARKVAGQIDNEIRSAKPLTLDDLRALPFRKRLRNRIIWLASPYL